MRKIRMTTGEKFERLTSIRFVKDVKSKEYWLFKCDCGKEKVIYIYSVIKGNSKSCGCLQKERARKAQMIHGISYSKTYWSWASMIERCNWKKSAGYKDYGGRGIKYCKRWGKFNNFYNDMGKRPEGKSLDRIDVNGNYTPKNCRWATNEEQANNRRTNVFVSFMGNTLTISQWAKFFGVKYNMLWRRYTLYGSFFGGKERIKISKQFLEKL